MQVDVRRAAVTVAFWNVSLRTSAETYNLVRVLVGKDRRDGDRDVDKLNGRLGATNTRWSVSKPFSHTRCHVHSPSVPLIGELARGLVLGNVADLGVAELQDEVGDDACVSVAKAVQVTHWQ